MTKLNSNMTTIYSTATVCNKPGDTNGTCYPLDPGKKTNKKINIKLVLTTLMITQTIAIV